MSDYRTEQEDFWAGDFGEEYTKRNRNRKILAANTSLFSRILRRADPPATVIEFGANVGLNLLALRTLFPETGLAAVEINAAAVAELEKIGGVEIHHRSLLDFAPTTPRDLVLVKGVLIHLAPEVLPAAYEILYRSTARYLCVAEYYNPTPVEVPYRGHSGKLFKRDFAGEILDRYPALRLVDYGFIYRRDPAFPMDDITWFLMERNVRGKEE